jgi:ABC-type Fe3+/spermidine/putrescine transport system ATPase subunit
VAVLQHGRVAQIGSAEELFERPRTRFVAEFIGRTNLLDVVVVGADRVSFGQVQLQVAARDLSPGARVVISIRPHQIELGPEASAVASDNVVAGDVVRASFLGDSVDYQVKLTEGDVVLRVTTPTPPRARPGERVRLLIPAGACFPLPDESPRKLS